MESKKKRKDGHEEPRGKRGIKTQTYQRMDLRIRGRGRVSQDKVREWHGHIYTTKRKIDSQWEAAAQHREISSVLCDHLEGWDREGRREGDARGKRYGDICICITDSLCYKAETTTPWQSNYIPIKMLKKKKKKKKELLWFGQVLRDKAPDTCNIQCMLEET